MPRKQVYGKRAKTTPLFSSSSVFTSSPAKAVPAAKEKNEKGSKRMLSCLMDARERDKRLFLVLRKYSDDV